MNSIIFNEVTKKYDSKTVLQNFLAEFELNGITVLMGESGCGKTTLLRLIASLEKADSGEITGVPDEISFMFQEDRLLKWFSAFDNVKITGDDTSAEKYIEKVFLSADRDTRVSELSGGMQRRVALARALAHKSDLVILDEPFKGMDAELKEKMIKLVVNESEARPFIIVIHEPQEAQQLHGRLVEFTGTPLEIIK